MMQCLMKKQETSTRPVVLTFPNPTNVKLSTMFVQKLVAVSISNITYLRGIFPERDFVDRELDGLHIKILTEKKDVASSSARELIQWVKGALEAFQKRYLRQLILYIYDNEETPDVALETYTFSFEYKEGELTINSDSAQYGSEMRTLQQNEVHVDGAHLRQAVVTLLRNNYMLTQRMKPLPNRVLLAMKLLYYDEVTPEDYEPPCFQKSGNPIVEFVSKPLKLKNGVVKTSFHSVKLDTKAIKSTFQGCESESEKEVNNEEDMFKEDSADMNSMDVCDGDTNHENEFMDCVPGTQPPTDVLLSPAQADIFMRSPAQPGSAINLTGSAFEESNCTEYRNAAVRCPCGVSRESGLQLLCQTCLHWNHAPCYRILKQQECPVFFYCVECHDPNDSSKACSDLSLINLSAEERKDMCLYRHVLSICLDTWRINAEFLMEELTLSASEAKQQLDRLDSDQAFKPKKANDKYRMINKRHLNSVLKQKYFTEAAVQEKAENTVKKPTNSKRNYEDTVQESKEKVEEEPTVKKRQKTSRSTKTLRNVTNSSQDSQNFKPMKGTRASFHN